MEQTKTIPKRLPDISWQVSEDVYRADPALSYSTLAKFEREGFNGIPTLFDKVTSPSLTFGSMVDTLLTGSQLEFEQRFYVGELESMPSDVIQSMVSNLFEQYGDRFQKLSSIPKEDLLIQLEMFNYYSKWKQDTRIKTLIDYGSELYKFKYLARGKEIVSINDYNDALACVDAIMNNPLTARYFIKNNEVNAMFEDSPIEVYHQLKFRVILKGIVFRCMFDVLEVNYKEKTIQPVDLKTSYHHEWDFFKSFVTWGYQIQCRLYWRILKKVISDDEYFRDFRLLPFKDVVVCRETKTPMVWDIPFTSDYGTLKFGENGCIVMRDPFYIAKELKEYIDNEHQVPIGLKTNESNNITPWLTTMADKK